MNRRSAAIAAVTAAFLLLGVTVFLFLRPEPAPPPRSAQAVYIWQRQWSPEVSASAGEAASATDTFLVLAAESGASGAPLAFVPFPVDWAALAKTGRPVWPVFRAHKLPALDTPAGRDAAATALADAVRAAQSAAAEAGLSFAGVQLDYDCPSRGLADYAGFLRVLRTQLPGIPLSITSLPDWLNRRELASVLDGLDHFVLQVHSLQRPARVNDPIVLCDTARVGRWVTQASELDCPFYVALPTYGYRLRFTPAGEFAGLDAEQAEHVYPGQTVREIAADPADIAAVVRALQSRPPEHFRGFAWFRMPVPGDRLNWTWPTLARVMAGRAPEARLRAEVRSPEPFLFEVWVLNEGDYRPVEPIRVPVDWRDATVAAYDTLGGFRAQNPAMGDSLELTGQAPAPGQEQMAAWFRMADSGTIDPKALRAERVETME